MRSFHMEKVIPTDIRHPESWIDAENLVHKCGKLPSPEPFDCGRMETIYGFMDGLTDKAGFDKVFV